MCRFAEEAEKIDESLGHSRSGFPWGPNLCFFYRLRSSKAGLASSLHFSLESSIYFARIADFTCTICHFLQRRYTSSLGAWTSASGSLPQHPRERTIHRRIRNSRIARHYHRAILSTILLLSRLKNYSSSPAEELSSSSITLHLLPRPVTCLRRHPLVLLSTA